MVDESIGSGGSGKDTIAATIDILALNANIEILLLLGGATIGTGNALANRIEGGTGNDSLSGLGGADLLIGNEGFDTLDGGDGADTMVGGAGNDDYYVSNAGDKIVEGSAGGSDTVFADVDYTLAANVNHLVLQAAANGAGNDSLEGGGDLDSLVGGAGDDTLAGFGGVDTLTGGAGRDVFRPSATAAKDVITDFEAGPLGDTLDFSDIPAGYTPGVSDANDFVQFVSGGGSTTVLVDKDGTDGGFVFVEVAVLIGVELTNVNQAVTEGNLDLG